MFKGSWGWITNIDVTIKLIDEFNIKANIFSRPHEEAVNSRLDLSDSVGLTQKPDIVKSIKPTLPIFIVAHSILV